MSVSSYASAGTLCLLLLVGCDPGQTEDSELGDISSSGAADSLFAYVHAIDDEPLVDAFSILTEGTYTRYVRTEQFDGEGYRLAFRERIARVRPDGSTLIARDSSGAFDYGYLRRFTSDEIDVTDPANIAELVVPDDPEYLSARSREVYTYASETSTLPPLGEVRVVEIEARPNEDAAIRRATLYVQPETKRLVAMRLQRSESAIWFRELSDLFVSIRPNASGGWLPHQVRIETALRMPLRPVQRFRTLSTYFDFDETIVSAGRQPRDDPAASAIAAGPPASHDL